MADKNLGDLIFDLALDDSKFQAAITRSIDAIKKLNNAAKGISALSVGDAGGVTGGGAARMAKEQSRGAFMRQIAAYGAAVRAEQAEKDKVAKQDEKRSQNERKLFADRLLAYGKTIRAEIAMEARLAAQKERADQLDRKRFVERLGRYSKMVAAEVKAAQKAEDAKVAAAESASRKIAAAAKSAAVAQENQGRKTLQALEDAAGNLSSALQTSFAAVFAAVAAAATAITVIGANFENTINKVGVISEASSSQMNMLTDAAREFGRTSSFSAQEAADAMLNFAQAGYTVEQNIAATGSAIKLAAASGSDLSLATSIMSDAISQFGLSTNQAANLADVFTFALNGSKLGMTDLGVSMRYAGTVGAGFGMTVEQTTAALMMFSDLGLKGSKAGTVFRLAMTKAADATAEAKRILEAHNISLDEINPALNDFGAILDVVAKKNISTSEAMEIFGLQAGASIVQLARQQEAMRASGKDFDGLVRSMEQATRDGIAGKTAASMQATVIGQFKRILAALRDLALGIYDAYAEPLKGLLTEALAIVNSVVGVFDSVGLSIEQGIGVALQNLTTYLRDNRVAIAGMIINAIEQFNRFGAEIIRLTPVFMGLVDAAMKFGSAILAIGDALATILPGVSTAGEALADLFVVSSIVAFVAGIYKAGVALGVFRAQVVATQVSLTSLTGGAYALLAVGGMLIGWLATYKASNDAATRSVENLAAAEQHRRLVNDEKYAKQLERINGALEATKNAARDQLRSGEDLSASRKAELEDIIRLTKEQALLEIQAGRLVQVNGKLLSAEQLVAQSSKTSAGQQSVLTQVYRDRAKALADATDRLSNLERAYADANAASKRQQESIIPGAATKEDVRQRVSMGAGADILSAEELKLAISDAKKEIADLNSQFQALDDQMLLANGTVKKTSAGMGEFEAATQAAKLATAAQTGEIDKQTDALQRLIDEAKARYDEVLKAFQDSSASEGELQAKRLEEQIAADNARYMAAEIAASKLNDASIDWEKRRLESEKMVRAQYQKELLAESKAFYEKEQEEARTAMFDDAERRAASRRKEIDAILAFYREKLAAAINDKVATQQLQDDRDAALDAAGEKFRAEDLAAEENYQAELASIKKQAADRFGAEVNAIEEAQLSEAEKIRKDANDKVQSILDEGVKAYREANKEREVSDLEAFNYALSLLGANKEAIAKFLADAEKRANEAMTPYEKLRKAFVGIFGEDAGKALDNLKKKFEEMGGVGKRIAQIIAKVFKGAFGVIKGGFDVVMGVVQQISGFSLNILGTIQDAIGFVQSEQKAAIEDASERAKAAGFDPAMAERRAAAATRPDDLATKFVDNLVGGAVRITQLFVAVVGPVISALAAQLPSLFTAVANAIPQIVTAFAQNIGPLVSAIVQGVPKVAAALIAAIPTIAKALIEAILYDLLPAIPEIAWSLVTSIWTALWETLKAAGGAIGGWIGSLFGGGDEGGPAAYSGMDYVPSTMRATLHQGEAVIPADRNARRLRGATAPAPAGADQNYGGRGGMGGFGPLEVAVIAEGRLLEAVQMRAEDMGRATGMGKRIRKAAGVKVGFSRGDYNPWSR